MPKLFSHSSEVQEIEVTISAQTFVKIILLIIGTIILLGVLRQASHSLVWIFTAVFLAIALNAPVSWVARHLPGRLKGKRGLATAVSTFLVLLVLTAFIASLVPPVVRQTKTLINRAPALVREVRDNNSDVGKFVDKYHLTKQVDKLSDQLGSRLQHISEGAISTFGSIASSIFAMVTIIVLTFMMLVEGPAWLAMGHRLVPKPQQARAKRLSENMYKVVKGFVNGQVLLAVIAAFMLLPGLLIFHVSYPVALMAVVFICGLIPLVGHTLGAVIVALVALFTSPISAIGILLYYILYQQIENYLIQPRLQASTTNMSPLLVFMSVVIGISFSGLLGGLVAIPIGGCLKVLAQEYLRSRDIVVSAKPATSSTK